MKDVNNKTIVITGGATGIGFGLAKELGSRGARIIIAEPRQENLQTATQALFDLGIDAKYYICDVTSLEQVEGLADFAWSENGRVDMLFNNAGVGGGNAKIVDANIDDVKAVFEVNFYGVWHGCKVFARRFEEQGTPAAIYNTGSENSLFNAVPNIAGYQASKHAVLALSDALREQVPDFINVGIIIPGFVASEMTKRVADMAMDADTFAKVVVDQVVAEQFYIVTHSFNMPHIQQRFDEISAAYTQYAPRYEGDDEYDVRTIRKALQAKQRK